MRYLVEEGGRELAKEVAFALTFLLLFEQAHFVMFSGLLVFFSCEAVILYNLFFQKLHLFVFFFLCFA